MLSVSASSLDGGALSGDLCCSLLESNVRDQWWTQYNGGLSDDNVLQRCIDSYDGALFMLGNTTGRKRHAASPAEADAVDALADMGEASFRSLQAALDSTRAEQSGPDHERIVTALARHLGTKRVEIGTIRALNAVLNKQVRPDKYRRNQDVIKAFSASAKQFYAYAKQVKDLMDLHQISLTVNSTRGSSSTMVGNPSAAGSSDLNQNSESSGSATTTSGTERTVTFFGPASPYHEFSISHQRSDYDCYHSPDGTANRESANTNIDDTRCQFDFGNSWDPVACLESDLESLDWDDDALIHQTWLDALLTED
jgi:hypothetical protein